MNGNHIRDVSRTEGGNAGSYFRLRNGQVGAFTLIELLVVISIILVLAGLIVGGASYAKRKSRESAVRAEMNKLITAIEAYYAAFGQYPPDNVVNQNPPRVNPVINPLFYELSGTIITNGMFQAMDGSVPIPAGLVRSTFNVEGFVNARQDPKELKKMPVTFTSRQYGSLTYPPPLPPNPDVRVLVVPVVWPLNLGPAQRPVSAVPGLNPWCYVSTGPTNNPTSFDLWADYVDGKTIRTICNWTKEVLERPLP